MGRKRTPEAKIREVCKLVCSGNSVLEACSAVGIAPSTYYRHQSMSATPKFPALNCDWSALTEFYRPTGIKGLTNKKRAPLAVEVKEAFERVFRRPARTMTPKQRAGELAKIENKIRPLVTACDGLSFEGIDYLDEEMPNAYSGISGQFEPAIARLREFIPALREEIEMLRSAHGMEFHHRGGRSTDPRIRAVAVQLADIYARYPCRHRTVPALPPATYRARFSLPEHLCHE